MSFGTISRTFGRVRIGESPKEPGFYSMVSFSAFHQDSGYAVSFETDTLHLPFDEPEKLKVMASFFIFLLSPTACLHMSAPSGSTRSEPVG